jgi:hypothetical protein
MPLYRVLALLLMSSLSGCVAGRVIDSLPDPPVAEDLSEPNYRRIVAESIGGIFTDAGSLGALEISEIWRANHLKGPVWATCLKIHADSAPQEYAIFIQDGKIVDQRVGVALDHCKQQAYEKFEPASFLAQKSSPVPQNKAGRTSGSGRP